MSDFGYYMSDCWDFLKELKEAERISPKEYGMMLQKKRKKKKKKKGGRQ